ncbi:four helix bundle protein [Roseofilum capinflatum]|uniref:Four helix bundle protein n=1 Tax=Roseofilum capinflatum BLCC-M114 TaxID=3022440 RepID=A0ABT7B5A3_9CYAN|nr:four helix bundle protein [Roseofilum capinflatum]MDJ1174362.1 four helix bundle protein [Roseofilum capinflatum BLCC-M114]
MSEIKDFKDLMIWQKGMDIAEKCYYLTQNFPREERYVMVDQIRRAAASIPANIAEGYGRRSRGDYARFLNIAQGSINELQTHLILSERVDLCTNKDIETILSLLQEETRMIAALIKKLNP